MLRPALLLATLAVAISATAQGKQKHEKHQLEKPRLDFSLSYVAEHANPVGSGGNFWLQGGSAELGADVWHGLGIAANVTGTHTASFGPNAIPLTLVTTTFGPRYRYSIPSRNLSVYGEGLLGEGHGVGSIFPSSTGLVSDALSIATQVGGGVDLGVSDHFAVRVVQASWVRTQLPNSTTNVQNNLRLGAGLVVKF